MAKITYSEYDCKHGKAMLKEGYTEKMKRCYDNYDERTHIFKDDCHCGNSRRHSEGYFVCPNGGDLMKVCGYFGMCGGIYKPECLSDKQLSFFEMSKEEVENG